MLKQYTNSRWLIEYKKTLKLSKLQRSILIGTILGDGYLRYSRSGKAARLQICHSVSAKEYVFWKQEIFKDWIFSEAKIQQSSNSLRFTTISHPVLKQYRNLFYVSQIKTIPKNIRDILKDSLSLAVWFMDDGNGYLHNNAYRIGTYAFGLEGNILFKECLRENFGIEVTLWQDVKGYCLYIPVRNGSALIFKQLIAPHMIPSMKYKLENHSPVETYMEGTRYSG